MTVRADNPFDVLALPSSTTDADRHLIDGRSLFLANQWNAKLRISRGGPGHERVEKKYGPEMDHYPARVGWAHQQLAFENGIAFWQRDLERKRLERAGAAMKEAIELSFADQTLTPEEVELLFKRAIEAGYDPDEFANTLLAELEARKFTSDRAINGATAMARLIRGGTWTAARPTAHHAHRFRTAVVIALATVIVAIVIRLLFTLPSAFDESIDAALKDGRIMAPPNSCAFDRWLDEACDNGRTKRVLAAAERIRRALSPLGERDYVRWYFASDPKVQWAEVAKVYHRLCILFPENREFLIRRTYAEGQVAFERGDYRTAFDRFQSVLTESRARSLNRLHALALNGIGRIYEAQQDDQSARNFYETCMSEEPEFAWSYVNRAKQQMRYGRWNKARLLMIGALNAAPRTPTILEALGNACEELHNDREALFYYEAESHIKQNARLVQRIAELRKRL